MPPGVPPIGLFRTFARNLPMTRAMRPWGATSSASGLALSMRELEIVIDRTCARCGCEYEWGVHVAFFAERAGLTSPGHLAHPWGLRRPLLDRRSRPPPHRGRRCAARSRQHRRRAVGGLAAAFTDASCSTCCCSPAGTTPGVTAGDYFVQTDTLTVNGRPGGTDMIHCVAAGNETEPGLCETVLVLGNATLTAAGRIPNFEPADGQPFRFAITGGTNRYRQARGEIVVTETATGYTATVDLQTPPNAGGGVRIRRWTTRPPASSIAGSRALANVVGVDARMIRWR